MVLHLEKAILTSNRLLQRYERLINLESFQKQLSILYNQPESIQYLSKKIPCPFSVEVDSFYLPILSVRTGKTVAYLRSGKIVSNKSARQIVWWADLLGAYTGIIYFKD